MVPDETLHALREFVVSIKAPLGTPVGGGMRSLNVAMRQNLDLHACVRPIRYFPGVASPMADATRLREAIKHSKRELAARHNVEEDLQRLIPGGDAHEHLGVRRRHRSAHG